MKFISKYPRLNMTYKPEKVKEVNGEVIRENAELIQFENNVYVTDDPGQIAHIKKNIEYGVTIHASEEESIQPRIIPEKDIIAAHIGASKGR